MSKKILIFCDPGIDDAIALLLAFFIDEIEIIGIVADYGNVPKEITVQNAHFLKQKSRNRDMKIFGGSDRPLNGGPPAFFTNIHGKEGLYQSSQMKSYKTGKWRIFLKLSLLSSSIKTN